MNKRLQSLLLLLSIAVFSFAQVPTKACRNYQTVTALPKKIESQFIPVPVTCIPAINSSAKTPSSMMVPITNEDCSTAQVVTPDGTCVNGTTVGAADNLTSTGGCQNGSSPTSHEDAWYQFTATGSQFTATVTTSGTWTGNVEFLLMSGSCAGLTLVGSNCGASPLTVSMTGLVQGNTYYFMISNSGTGANGPFTVCPTTTNPPMNCTDNDDCAAPTAITYTLGQQVCVTDCNTGAAPGPDFAGSNCYDFNNPTVWYSVTTDASTAVMDIALSSGSLTNPYFTVFTTADCQNYTIINCTQGSAGSATATVGVSPNTTYLIAVSDQGGLQGNFNLCITPDADNSSCNTNDVLTEVSSSDPATPVGGPYSAGESVNFCYTINQFQKANCNWLMGIVPTFGDCWSASSFNANGMPVTSTPPAVAGNESGTWAWYAAGQVVYNNINGGYLPANTPLPGGWFFQCNSCGLSSTDPDNSWGDGGAAGAPANDCDLAGNGYTWQVCFTLIAGTNANCTNGTTNCGISIKTYADGEIGGWSDPGCTADLPYNFYASFACCTPSGANAGADAALTCTTTTVTLNGSATATGPTYTWTGPGIVSGGNTANPVVNAPGTYILSVSATGACTSTDTVIVSSNTVIPTANAGADMQLTCTTSSVTLNGTSSSSGMTYSWTGPGIVSGGATTSAVVNAAGVYTITVTNTLTGCQSTDVASVTVNNTIPNANAGADMVITCTSPSVTLVGTSSTGGVSYSWSGPGIVSGGSSANAVVNASGNYTVTVTNPANGCTNTDVASVTTNTTAPNANAGADMTLSCAVSSVNLTGTSSTGGVNFSWSGPGGITGSSATLNTSTTGTYTLTVTDPTNGCTATDNAIVSPDANLPNANAGSPQILTCTTTTVTLTGSSTTPSATFSWTGPSIVSGAATATATVNGSGSYTLTVTDPNNGCTNTSVVSVTSNTVAPNANAGSDLTISCSTTSVTLTGTSSTSNTTLGWSGPNGFSAAAATATVTTAGTYTLGVVDMTNGCTNTDVAIVTIDTISPNADAGTGLQLTCAVSSGSLNATSTTAGATFGWNGPSGFTSAAQSPTVTANGTYTVTVTNPANGCTAVDLVVVSLDTVSPNANAGLDQVIDCSSSTATLNGSSSTVGASFSWNGPSGFTSTSQTPAVTTAGTYTLVVTDANNGCTATDLVDVTGNSAAPDANAGLDQVISCSVSTATLSATSATSGATYSWSGPGGFTSNSQNPTVTTTGTYTLTVTDPSNGCVATDVADVTASSALPDANAGLDQVVNCAVTTATISATSVTSGATFSWSGPGGFSSANQTETVTTTGTYTITVTDPSNGCTSTDVVDVTANTTAPDANAGADQSFGCASPTATLTASTTVTNAAFSWNGPNGFSSNSASITVNDTGMFVVTIMDPSNGCTATDTALVTLNGTLPSISVGSAQTINCTNTTATITGNSTTTGVLFTWNGPGGFTTSGDSAVVPVAGVYTLTVTDSLGNCPVTDSVVVSADTTAPNINPGSNQTITCTTTSVVISGSSSTTGATFSWSGPSGFALTNASDTVTSMGTYTLVVTDPTNGCTSIDSVIIGTNTALPVANAGSPQTLDCINTSATLTGSSTNPNLTYSWSGPAGALSGNPVNVTTPGTYTVTATDPATGCSDTATVLISSNTTPPSATATATTSTLTCIVTSTQLTASSNATNANYAWIGPAGALAGNPVTVTTAGMYTVTVTDNSNGCSSTATYSVASNTQQPTVSATAANDSINCANPSTTIAAISLTGTNYSWTGPNGFTSASQTPTGVSDAGTYTVVVTDQVNGCSDTATVTLYSAPNPNASFTANPSSGVAPQLVNFTNTSSGFTSYSWNFGDTTNSVATNPSYIYTSPGMYTVTLIGSNGVAGCNDTATIAIVILEPETLIIPNVFTPNGDNINEFFQVTATGYEEMTVDIFNRWGAKLATFNGLGGHWDGGGAPDGTYYYLLKGKKLDGTEKEQQGYFMLAR